MAYSVGNNSIKDYLLALAVFVLAASVLKIFKFVIVKKLKNVVTKTRTELDDLLIKIIDNVGWPVYLLLSLYLALNYLRMPGFIEAFMHFALLVAVAYYVDTGDYNKYMDIQEEINFAIKERFEKKGIEFAFPTQTIFLNNGK